MRIVAAITSRLRQRRVPTSRTFHICPKLCSVTVSVTACCSLNQENQLSLNSLAPRLYRSCTMTVRMSFTWTHVNHLVYLLACLLQFSYCVPADGNDGAARVGIPITFGCYPHRPGPIDQTAPAVDCARALLQFPKNASPGMQRLPLHLAAISNS